MTKNADDRRQVNPWIPMSKPIDLKHLGKLEEEVSELGSAIARCLIQGIDEREPVTGKPNREWLQDEIADVKANSTLCIEHFGLDQNYIDARANVKIGMLRQWHQMLADPWSSDWEAAPRSKNKPIHFLMRFKEYANKLVTTVHYQWSSKTNSWQLLDSIGGTSLDGLWVDPAEAGFEWMPIP